MFEWLSWRPPRHFATQRWILIDFLSFSYDSGGKGATFGTVSSECFVVSQNVGIIFLQFPNRMTFNFTIVLFPTSVCGTADEAMAQTSCCNKRLRYGWPGHGAIVKLSWKNLMRGAAVLLLDFLFFGIAARYRSKDRTKLHRLHSRHEPATRAGTRNQLYTHDLQSMLF